VSTAAELPLDKRRRLNALERVKTAISANRLSTEQRDSLIEHFNRGWWAVAGSQTAQRQHTDTICELAAKLAKRPDPQPPKSPTRMLVQVAA